MTVPLSPAQQAALDHVTAYASARQTGASKILEEIQAMCDISDTQMLEVMDGIRRYARIALHFHPDRLDAVGRSVAKGLLTGGMYKSQFETGISNGSVSAYPGGQRDLWEQQLFGGAYHGGDRDSADRLGDGTEGGKQPDSGQGEHGGKVQNATANTVSCDAGYETDGNGGLDSCGSYGDERPKYGALDLMLHPDGPSPRFGSCYLLLKPEVSARATFTYLDSHQLPDERGTYRAFDSVLAAILRDAFLGDYAIGEHGLTPPRFVAHVRERISAPIAERFSQKPARNLNHYVEAQVHGPVMLARDAEALVADPAFQGTPTGALLEQLCAAFRLTLHWHGGFAMAASAVPTDFRGRAMPSLAARIAQNGRINARTIGEAAAEVRRHPERWQDRGEPAEVLQQLKLLWHVLVRFGEAAP
ncbi:DUF3626 domain-containing protein [Paenibacillus daejeonensis]|uniref:DUF3626 domain-containing protein n=1 Tax=Paenibacillus daejeonensis TaxID=135193 RepID=UPI000382DE13|nr:DUF3626 domain-containing protein [Paenibacillus daejeonensis]